MPVGLAHRDISEAPVRDHTPNVPVRRNMPVGLARRDISEALVRDHTPNVPGRRNMPVGLARRDISEAPVQGHICADRVRRMVVRPCRLKLRSPSA